MLLWNYAVIGHTLLPGITVRTPIRLFTLDIGVAQFRSVTKLPPKSPFSCVNGSPSQYDFRGGAKAIQCSVNGKPSLGKILSHSTTDKAGAQRTFTYQYNSN